MRKESVSQLTGAWSLADLYMDAYNKGGIPMPRRSTCFIALVALLFTFSAHAAAFLKFDGVDGESQDKAHKGWIDVVSWSWGESQPSARGSGKCDLQDIVVVKEVDKASPQLRRMASSRTVIPQAIVEISGERHLLQNVKIKGVQPAVSPDGTQAEQISLNFARCATHAAAVLSPAAHKHKGELKLQAPGSKPVLIGLLLPAVQKVRDAAVPQAALDEILIGLSLEGPGKAKLLLQGGSQAATLLQRAFQTQQKLDFLEVSRKDQPHMKIKMTEVLITSYQTGGSSGIPSESLAHFPKVEMNRAVQLELKYKSMEGNPATFQDVASSW
jgi:type VI protein secretion system component Hcp